MNISPVKNYNLSFCANNVNYLRSTIDGRRKYACCYTRMFRSDLDWNLLSYYLENKYKNAQKVNVLNAACSDGSEPYSLAMILDKKIPGGKKFFPIEAFDCSKLLIDDANNGIISLSPSDVDKFDYYNLDIDDYMKPSYQSVYKRSEEGSIPYFVAPVLRNKVNFSCGDILSKLSKMDNKTPNTVLLCRNMIPYLSINEISELFKLINKKLGRNSAVIIGSYDLDRLGGYIDVKMRQINFKEAELFRGSLVYEN